MTRTQDGSEKEHNTKRAGGSRRSNHANTDRRAAAGPSSDAVAENTLEPGSQVGDSQDAQRASEPLSRWDCGDGSQERRRPIRPHQDFVPRYDLAELGQHSSTHNDLHTPAVSSAEFHLRNLPSVVSNITTTEGFGALWKGNVATLIRVFPYSGIQFMVFDRCKSYFLRQHKQQSPGSSRKWGLSPMESLVSGMCAGTISVICTYPLDLTRAQLAVRRKHKGCRNIGFSGILAQTYRNRGVKGLFRGITPTLVGILPYSGIAFTLNEQGKREVRWTPPCISLFFADNGIQRSNI